MPDTPSITTIKRMNYRGLPEEWSNTYHFEGTTPVDAAAWKTLADALIAEEKKIVSSAVTFVRAYGYEAGNENSVAQIDYTVAPLTPAVGTLVGSGGTLMAGDQAWWIRWWTGATARGKKVYCRKYFHSGYVLNSDSDVLLATMRTAAATFAAKVIDGTLPGSFKYCGPQGADLSLPVVGSYSTTRTLKRRGKRPPTSP